MVCKSFHCCINTTCVMGLKVTGTCSWTKLVCHKLVLFQAQRGGGGERALFQPFTHALDYLGFHQVLISGRVPQTPSKSHGWLYDITIHRFKPANSLSSFYPVPCATYQWRSPAERAARSPMKPQVTSCNDFVDSLFFSSTDFTGVRSFALYLQINRWMSARVFFFTQCMLL